MQDLAILAGRGALPIEILRAHPTAMVVTFEDIGFDFSAYNHFEAQFEKTGALFKALNQNHITKLCFAGAVSRPDLKMSKLDFKTISLLPRIQKAISQSDGKTLSIIRGLVEAEGFEVLGAHEICPELLVKTGVLGSVDIANETGIERAIEIHNSLSILDLGQALVMRKGHCLAVETLFGTEKMLKFVAGERDHSRKAEGFMFKSSKIKQDLKLDMASIGPDTITQIHQAGLAGIVLGAEKTLIINREETILCANELGIYIKGVSL